MPDVFISYSRRDKDFVRRLHDALGARGKDVWVDWEDIAPSADWVQEVREGIEASNAFVFVLTPTALGSTVCAEELRIADADNKRIIPLLVAEVDGTPVPDSISHPNWISFTGANGFDPGVDTLVRTMDTDLGWVKAHTLWGLRAGDWDRNGREDSYLVRGTELRSAQAWLEGAQGKDPAPTKLHYDYVVAAERASRRRRQVVRGAVGVALVVAIALAVVALIQRANAVSQQQVATARELAAQSLLQLSDDPELSLLLAIESAKKRHTVEGLAALRSALAADHLRMTLRADGSPVRTAAWSRDGKLVATGAQNGVVRVWDAASGALRRAFRGHRSYVTDVAFDPSGRRVLSTAYDATARIWDVAGTAPPVVMRYRNDWRVDSGAWSPYGTVVATRIFLNDPARLWDARTGRPLLDLPTPHAAAPTDVEFSNDGGRVAVSDASGVVRLWDVAGGNVVRTLGPATAQKAVESVRFGPGGHRLLTAGDDGHARSYDLDTGKITYTSLQQGELRFAVWSPTGQAIATASATGKSERIYDLTPGHDGVFLSLNRAADVTAVQFSPGDGKYLLTAGDDGVAQVADASNANPLLTLRGHRGGAIDAASFSPDGSRVLTAGEDGTARIWDAGTAPAPTPPEIVPARSNDQIAGYGPEGYGPDPTAPLVLTQHTTDFAADAGATIRRPLAGAPALAQLRGDRFAVRSASFDRAGRIVLTAQATVPATTADASHPVAASVWDARTGRLLRTLAGPGSVAAAGAVSADGRVAATVDDSEAVTVWSTGTGRRLGLLRGLHRLGAAIASVFVKVSDDGRLVVAGNYDGRAILWRVRDGKVLNRFAGPGPRPRENGSAGGAISPDDRTVVFTTPWDQLAHVYRVGRPREIGTLAGSALGIWDAVFSSDGALLATTSESGGARVWDMNSRRALTVFSDPGNRIGFSRDGRSVVSAGSLGAAAAIAFPCDVCSGFDGLLAAARRRVSRGLTPEERAQYLH